MAAFFMTDGKEDEEAKFKDHYFYKNNSKSGVGYYRDIFFFKLDYFFEIPMKYLYINERLVDTP